MSEPLSLEQFVDQLVKLLHKLPTDSVNHKLDAVLRCSRELNDYEREGLASALRGVIERFDNKLRRLEERQEPRGPLIVVNDPASRRGVRVPRRRREDDD